MVKKNFNIVLAVAVLLILNSFFILAAQIPQTMGVQGKLTDSSGVNVSGSFNMVFKIYNNVSGGTALYDSGTQAVSVNSNGFYSAVLSNVNLTFEEQYYLGIAVGSDAEMTPRINLTSSPYSFKSNNSDFLRNYSSSYFFPINTSVTGNFTFNGGWEAGGITIQGGKIFADTGYFYNISRLNVSTLNINSSLLPTAGFDNTFDLGNATWRWRDLWLGRNANVSGNVTASYFHGLINYSDIQNVPATALGNPFNQVLNTTSNVTHYNLNLSNRLNLNPITIPVGNANQGDIFYNSSLTSPMFYNGSSWRVFGYGSPIGTLAAFNSTCPSGWSSFGDNTKQTDLGGRWVLIQNYTVSGAGVSQVTLILNNSNVNYSGIQIILNHVQPVTNNVNLWLLWNNLTANYAYAAGIVNPLPQFANGGSGSGAIRVLLASGNLISNAATNGLSGTLTFYDSSDSVRRKQVIYDTTYLAVGVAFPERNFGFGDNTDTSAVTSVQLNFSTGNIANGTFMAYGLVTAPTLLWCQKTSDDTPITAGLWSLINGYITQTTNTNNINLSGMLYTTLTAVGIGTSNPLKLFHVIGDSLFNISSAQTFEISNNANASYFFLNGSNGFTGLGTRTPSQTLDVRGQGNFSGVIYFNNGTKVGGVNSTGLNSMQTFTSAVTDATYTTPAGVTKIVIEVWGSGGSGGAGTNGNFGGTSCFGSNTVACTVPLLQATGGLGGIAAGGAGGNGGVGTLGKVNLKGNPGDTGLANIGTPGGASPRGGGGGDTAAGTGGTCGGGGGGSADANAGGGGGAGGYSMTFLTNLNSTYKYTVAAGVSAPAGGGVSGVGCVIVTEYS